MIHRIALAAALASIFALAAFAAPAQAQAQAPEEVAQAALEAAPVWDGHNDVPIQLRGRRGNVLDGFDFEHTHAEPGYGDNREETSAMHTDLPRLRTGKVGAQWWSVYVSSAMDEPEAVQATMEQIDVTKRLIAAYPDDMTLALTADDVAAAMAQGKIAGLLGMEGGHSIGSSLAVLRQMYALGARYMTITHSRNLGWADSADADPEHGGLTDFGRDVVREMNRLGMLVDLSHVSEETMMDALDVAQAPVIFSHSNARAVSEESRNVPDGVLDRLPENGGLVMVTFVTQFVSPQINTWYADRNAEQARQEYLWQGQPDKVSAAMEAWLEANPQPLATIAQVADHIDYIRDRIGIDHIGIGGDYDGMPPGPAGLEDVAGYPALFTELARRGYSQGDLEKIASRNMMRVMRAAEAYAASAAQAPPIETPVS